MPESGHHSARDDDPRLNSATPLTYAVGDIHGSLMKLRRLITGCTEHAEGRPARFVFLGDYIDRGPESAGVIDYLIALQGRLPGGVVALKGNHEAIALEVFDGTAPEDFWLSQGGEETLASYGVAAPQLLPRAHIDWMRALPLRYDDGSRFFVHAGIDPERPLGEQNERDLIWIREPFLSDRRDHGRLIVHGHTPVAARTPDLRSNRLNIDTGAVYGGPLTAAAFAGGQTAPIAFLQAP
jgi:serine/threonine protein phosphatase 1